MMITKINIPKHKEIKLRKLFFPAILLTILLALTLITAVPVSAATPIIPVVISLSDYGLGATANYTIYLRLGTDWSPGDDLHFNFPYSVDTIGWVSPGPQYITQGDSTGTPQALSNTGYTFYVSGPNLDTSKLIISRSSGNTISAGSTVILHFQGVVNPTTTGNYTVNFYNNSDSGSFTITLGAGTPTPSLNISVVGTDCSVDAHNPYTYATVTPGTVPAGTIVELSPNAADGWYFDHWEGDLTGWQNIPGTSILQTVYVVGPTTVTAVFKNSVHVDVSCTAGGGTVSPGSGDYAFQSKQTFTATPSQGWHFVKWTYNGNDASGYFSSGESYSIDVDMTPLMESDNTVVDSNFSLFAVFAQNEVSFNITTSGSGTVTRIPEAATYSGNTAVQLTANADPGWRFDHWHYITSDGDVYYDSTANPLTFTVNTTGDNYPNTANYLRNGPVDMTAYFSPNTYTVTFNKNGGDTEASPSTISNIAYNGTAGTLPAPPTRAGYTFTGWNTASDGSGTVFTASTPVTNNITVYAQWTINSYTVIFDSQGGSAVNSQAVEYGGKVTQPADPAKTGYTFGGWYKEVACTSVWNFASDIVTSNTTLYAKWIANTYTVSFDAQGGSSTPSPITVTYGSTYGTLPTVTRTSYTFNGWYTATTGGTLVTGSTPVTITADQTLYAQWTALPTYTVTYNGNGNTGGTVPVDSNSYTSGATVTVLGNTGNLVRTHFTFNSWNTAADGSGTAYTIGAQFSITGNVTLYAQWTANPTYTVTYNGNGNTGGTVPTDSNAYYQGDTVTVLGNIGSLVKTGFTFNNWNTAANGSGTSYNVDATFSMGTANVALYSRWTAVPTYTVIFDSQGGSPVDSLTNVTSGSTIARPADPAKTGYTFDGWYKEAACQNAWNFAADTVTSNVTLYAKWTINTYTLTINAANGTVAKDPDRTNYDYGTSVQLTATPAANYTFSNWSGDASGNDNPLSVTMDGNKTITANFSASTYTVTFNKNGGDIEASPNTISNIAYNGIVGTLPTPPARAGYIFTGWNTASDGSGTVFTASTPVTNDITVYAQWTAQTYTVTYDANGGMGTAPTESSKAIGATFATATNTFTPPAGKQFKEWNTAADGSGTSYAPGATVTMPASNLTLYAIWENIPVVTYTVIFDSQGGSAVASQTINAGSTATKPTDPVRTGYTFGGWYTEAACTNAWAFANDTITSDITLYAKWTVITFTITATAGDHGSISPSGAVTVNYGDNQTFNINPDSGYHIDTLTVDDSPVNPALTNYTFTDITASHTIAITFARNPVNQYALTVNIVGQGSVSRNPDQTTFIENTSVQLIANTSTGWSFSSWSGVDSSSGNTASVIMNSDKTVDATFIINKFTVTFDSRGGSAVGSQTVGYGSKVTRPTDPTRTGYAFGGWYQESTCTTDWNFDTNMVTGNRTLCAGWEVIVNNGGTEGQAKLSSVNLQMDDSTTLNLQAGVQAANGSNQITIGGESQNLNNYTGGNLVNINLTQPQNVGGQEVKVQQAVCLKSGVTGQPVTITNSGNSNISISIPDSTTIMSNTSWDGTLIPPKAVPVAGTAPAGFAVGNTVIEVGSPSGTLLFDKPVILELKGVTGPVGYKPAGSDTWVPITRLAGGTYDNPAAPDFPGEAFITNGTDTRIITWHFTSFASLTASTVTTLTSSINPSEYGQSVTFTATVSSLAGIPAGTVTIKDGATTLGTVNLNSYGKAVYSTSALSVGSHSIAAVYSGDTNYNSSTSQAITQTVSPVNATTSGTANQGQNFRQLTSNGFNLPANLRVNENGLVQSAVQLKSQDGKITVDIAAGTELLDSQGIGLGSFNVIPMDPIPAPPDNQAIILAYDFGPHGATFNPPLTITLSYDPAKLPERVAEKNLHMAYFDGTQWQSLDSSVDTQANTVSAQISHFSGYALLNQVIPVSTPASTAPAPSVSTSPSSSPSPAPVSTVMPAPAPATSPKPPVSVPPSISPPQSPVQGGTGTSPFNWTLVIGIIIAILAVFLVVLILVRRRNVRLK